MSVNLIEKFITKNPAYISNVNKADSRYTDFQKNGPKGAVLHSVGTPQPSALVFANNWNQSTADASVHAIIQEDGTGYQLAPWNFRLWHVAGSANNTHIGIEMTEPDCIWYDEKNGYKLHIKDMNKALAFVQKTYSAAVELFAELCIQFDWNPLEPGVIISHAEAYKMGIGGNHGDPEHLWDGTKSGYTMDTFRHDVSRKVNQIVSEKKEPEVRYELLRDVKEPYYRKTLDKLIRKGFLKGKGGKGDELVLDLGEDAIRTMVTLDRAGVYGE